ncbi:MAG: DUF6323 family protein [Clostridiales bacterium]|nr:DUF6323 family protein [Clostridiales bacterium]
MGEQFSLLPDLIINQQATNEIIKCNEKTSKYGLVLSDKDAIELVETRNAALLSNGRIEFGGGIINKLISEFCNSPFLSQYDYANTLHELIETFYYFKNETLDQIGDDDLIIIMKKYFDDRCNGSIELLQGRELEQLAKNIRFDKKHYEDLDSEEDIYDEEEWE